MPLKISYSVFVRFNFGWCSFYGLELSWILITKFIDVHLIFTPKNSILFFYQGQHLRQGHSQKLWIFCVKLFLSKTLANWRIFWGRGGGVGWVFVPKIPLATRLSTANSLDMQMETQTFSTHGTFVKLSRHTSVPWHTVWEALI